MKEIINGTLYDTETAKPLGEWRSNQNSAGQDDCVLALYQKTNGEFFLACSGAGKQHYVCQISDGCIGREKGIVPLSPEDAASWAEDHLSVDEYIAAFGRIAEDDGYMSTYLLLPAVVMEKAQEAAATVGIDFSGYIEKLIRSDNQSA